MDMQEKSVNYERIAKAIQYIIDNHTQQPSLEEIAEHIHLSPFHFQRIFQEWAGTTPKKFLQFISLSQAKRTLKDFSISETTHILGLSSSSRLHDMFLTIEAMTPSEYKNEGASLRIFYSKQLSPFGPIVIGSTNKGVCQISFIEKEENPKEAILSKFPKAECIDQEQPIHRDVMQIFSASYTDKKNLRIHLKGSGFQLKVWEALLRIPVGKLCTYGDIAKSINQPSASRAVGTAIGANPLAYLIPCHRVIQATGLFGGYRWDPIRKTAIIGWEAVVNKRNNNEAI